MIIYIYINQFRGWWWFFILFTGIIFSLRFGYDVTLYEEKDFCKRLYELNSGSFLTSTLPHASYLHHELSTSWHHLLKSLNTSDQRASCHRHTANLSSYFALIELLTFLIREHVFCSMMIKRNQCSSIHEKSIFTIHITRHSHVILESHSILICKSATISDSSYNIYYSEDLNPDWIFRISIRTATRHTPTWPQLWRNKKTQTTSSFETCLISSRWFSLLIQRSLIHLPIQGLLLVLVSHHDNDCSMELRIPLILL